jgi:thioredoxin reductase
MADIQQVAVIGEDDCAFDDVFELTNIAGQ